jgi:hypothetical protein
MRPSFALTAVVLAGRAAARRTARPSHHRHPQTVKRTDIQTVRGAAGP